MNRPNRTYWTSADGQRTCICDMTDRHLINAIRMLERQAQALLDVEEPFPIFQGELAQYYAERDWYNAHFDEDGEPIDLYDIASQHPHYDDLVTEAQRRGLTWEPPVA